jgi:hypothetical protein
MTQQWNELEFDPETYPPRPARPVRRGGFVRGIAGFLFALGAVGVVGGAVYLGFRHSARVVDETGIPVIKADGRPVKARPEQPGGIQVPNQDKLVFDRLDPEAAPPIVERLLPPPETPLPRPVAPPPPPAPPPGQAANPPRTLPDSKLRPPPIPLAPGQAPPGEPAPTATANASPTPGQAQTSPGQAPAPTPGQAQGQAPTKPAAGATQPAKPPKPVQTAPGPMPLGLTPPAQTPSQLAAVPPAKTAATAPIASAGKGSWRIQLASVRSEAEAQAEWRRLQARHPALGGLGMSVARADLGDKGVFYRIQAGPLDETRAKAICTEFKTQNLGCQVVHP